MEIPCVERPNFLPTSLQPVAYSAGNRAQGDSSATTKVRASSPPAHRVATAAVSERFGSGAVDGKIQGHVVYPGLADFLCRRVASVDEWAAADAAAHSKPWAAGIYRWLPMKSARHIHRCCIPHSRTPTPSPIKAALADAKLFTRQYTGTGETK